MAIAKKKNRLQRYGFHSYDLRNLFFIVQDGDSFQEVLNPGAHDDTPE